MSGIAADKDGNIWFSDSLNATVGYFIPSKRTAKIQPLTDSNAHPHDGLVVQSNGTVWFTEQFGSLLPGELQGPALVMWPKGTLK
jgi:streptogramin lyase